MSEFVLWPWHRKRARFYPHTTIYKDKLFKEDNSFAADLQIFLQNNPSLRPKLERAHAKNTNGLTILIVPSTNIVLAQNGSSLEAMQAKLSCTQNAIGYLFGEDSSSFNKKIPGYGIFQSDGQLPIQELQNFLAKVGSRNASTDRRDSFPFTASSWFTLGTDIDQSKSLAFIVADLYGVLDMMPTYDEELPVGATRNLSPRVYLNL